LLYLFEDCALDTERRELHRGPALVAIEPKVFDLLAFVVENRQRVVSRDDLIAQVWDGRIVSESALARCINGARSAIGDNGEAQRLIKTFQRKGLRFVGSVREARQPSEVARAVPEAAKPTATLALPDRPSIAVLPLDNSSGDKEQDYFSDGITEDIITELCGSPISSSSPTTPPCNSRERRWTYARSAASLACTTSCREAFAAEVIGFAYRCSSLTR
jgi:DNA-binding winged helix-turn-helix (wHTH) protein